MTRRTAWILLFAIAMVLASAVATQASQRIMATSASTRDPSSMDRIYLSLSSIKMFRDHPVLGVGIGAFALAYPGYRDSRVNVSPVTDPHQSAFSIPAETGVLGLLAECGVAAALIWAAVRVRRFASDGDASVAGLAASGSFLAMSFLNTQQYTYYFWIALALAGATMLEQVARKVRT